MTSSNSRYGDDLTALKYHYRFEDWSNRLEENLLVWKLSLSGSELPGWTMSEPQRSDAHQWPRLVQSWWQPEGGDSEQLIRLDIIEGTSEHDGREHLLRILGEIQVPTVERIEADPLGDVAFIVADEYALFFARANLGIRLRSATQAGAPVRELGVALDRWLVGKDVFDKGMPPKIRAFQTTAKPPLAVGQIANLEIDATDALERTVSYKIFAQLGELRIVDGLVTYRPAVEGTDELTLIAISEDGSTATATLELQISGAG